MSTRPKLIFIFFTLVGILFCTSLISDDLIAAVADACSCPPKSLALPLRGKYTRDWVVNAQVNIALRENRIQDEEGRKGEEALTSMFHTGEDFDLSDFRAMDMGVPVFASVDAEVIEVHDGEFDRQMLLRENCEGYAKKWNFVRTRHAHDGYEITYGHLRKGSIAVRKGQKIKVGDRLGEVGSSGCSRQPHLHFEVRNCRGETQAPIHEKLWRDENIFSKPELGLMDYVLKKGNIKSLGELIDPVPNVNRVNTGSAVGLALITANGQSGDKIKILVMDPKNTLADQWQWEIKRSLGHHYWYSHFTVGKLLGDWQIKIIFNERVIRTISLVVF